MRRINTGIIAFKGDGSMLWFPDGNVGKDTEYQRFIKTPEAKKLSLLFAEPVVIYERLNEKRVLDDLKDWLDEQHPEILEEFERRDDA